MPSVRSIPETAVAQKVVVWLQAQAWEVYQEVEGPSGRCDIVAVKDGLLWAIEVKTSLSFALVEQALGWQPYANHVSVAIPKSTGRNRNGHALLPRLNLGLIEVRSYRDGGLSNAWEAKPAPLLPAPQVDRLQRCLDPGQKSGIYAVAGSPRGGYWTPFKQSCEAVQVFVSTHQGCTVRQLVDSVGKLHYTNPSCAKSGWSRRIDQGVVKQIWMAPDRTLWAVPKDFGQLFKVKLRTEDLAKLWPWVLR